MFDGAEISKAAECQVWLAAYYNKENKPIHHDLLDPRMGPASKFSTCETCHGNFTSCPGHFGYLKLALPVYNVGYFNSIMNILKSVCKSCGRILLVEKERKYYSSRMRKPTMEALQKIALEKEVVKKCKPVCSRCGYVNGTTLFRMR